MEFKGFSMKVFRLARILLCKSPLISKNSCLYYYFSTKGLNVIHSLYQKYLALQDSWAPLHTLLFWDVYLWRWWDLGCSDSSRSFLLRPSAAHFMVHVVISVMVTCIQNSFLQKMVCLKGTNPTLTADNLPSVLFRSDAV